LFQCTQGDIAFVIIMAFTMHSHSGQFCPGHAKDQLEDIVKHAISIGYKTMGLTEHMPRIDVADLYPEEVRSRTANKPVVPSEADQTRKLKGDPHANLAGQRPLHAAYLVEAQRLRAKYAGQIELLIGFEGEFIRPDYAPAIKDMAAHPAVDYFVGSLHHVCGVPIDYDQKMYDQARSEAVQMAKEAGAYPLKHSQRQNQPPLPHHVPGPPEPRSPPLPIQRNDGDAPLSTEAAPEVDEEQDEAILYARYYDEQHVLLTTLKPRVVGHFDLIKLLSPLSKGSSPPSDLQRLAGGAVWTRILSNLQAIKSYGGLLECNTSALRKGLPEPYPGRQIAEVWRDMGGRFTMSDDSHGIAQVATNYERGLAFLERLGVTEIWTFTRRKGHDVEGSGQDAELAEKSVSLTDFRKSLGLAVHDSAVTAHVKSGEVYNSGS
jgi:histidinol-phosphatase (PHP family)